jgi:hypothetical protein
MNAPMNAPMMPPPSNPRVGQVYGSWVWNGARWEDQPATRTPLTGIIDWSGAGGSAYWGGGGYPQGAAMGHIGQPQFSVGPGCGGSGVSINQLVAQGAGAPGRGGLCMITEFLASSVVLQLFDEETGGGTYTPTSGLLYAKVECLGGGGAGGGVQNPDPTFIMAGGGGGAGGYSLKWVTAAQVAGGVAVTIAPPAQGVVGGHGGNGGVTSFGTLCIANGGTGGLANTAGVFGASWGGYGNGATAVGAVGDLVVGGNSGLGGNVIVVQEPGNCGARVAIGWGGMPFDG